MYKFSLSIILPCYNVEKFIGECLDSIFSQDISEEEYEVICVNDYSTDKTSNVIFEYQKLHTNLILINHDDNKKQGAARNTGLKYAQGKYIWFVDPDDLIEKDCLLELITEMSINKLDVLNFDILNLKGESRIENSIYNTTNIQTGSFFINSINNWWENGSPCRRIYDSYFLQSTKTIFREYGYLEDQIFSLRTVFYAKRFKHIAKYYYLYRWNENSSMNGKMDNSKILSVFAMISDLLVFSSEINETEFKLALSVREVAFYNLNSIFKSYLYFNYKERKIAISHIENHLLEILDSNYFHGWKLVLLSYLKVSTVIFFFLSPFLRFMRNFKRSFFNSN